MEKVENRKKYTQEQFYAIVHQKRKIYIKKELKKSKNNLIKLIKENKTYFS
jgi:hypothetical protein